MHARRFVTENVLFISVEITQIAEVNETTVLLISGNSGHEGPVGKVYQQEMPHLIILIHVDVYKLRDIDLY